MREDAEKKGQDIGSDEWILEVEVHHAMPSGREIRIARWRRRAERDGQERDVHEESP